MTSPLLISTDTEKGRKRPNTLYGTGSRRAVLEDGVQGWSSVRMPNLAKQTSVDHDEVREARRQPGRIRFREGSEETGPPIGSREEPAPELAVVLASSQQSVTEFDVPLQHVVRIQETLESLAAVGVVEKVRILREFGLRDEAPDEAFDDVSHSSDKVAASRARYVHGKGFDRQAESDKDRPRNA
jgi:hypothetical protein